MLDWKRGTHIVLPMAMTRGSNTNRNLIACLLFTLAAVAYYLPEKRLLMDSNFSMLLSESLWKNHSFKLDEYFDPSSMSFPGQQAGALPYQLYRYDGHVYYIYPPGSSILSVPFVMGANALGFSARDQNGGYRIDGELRIQRFIASFVTAATVALLFLLGAEFLDTRRAFILALIAAFGTGLWSTASRVLWTHTWGLLLLSAALLVLVRMSASNSNDRWFVPVFLATLLSWLYFTRPTFSVTIMAVSLFILVYHRRMFLPYAITGAAWCALFICFSYVTSGGPLPPYFRAGQNLALHDAGSALCGVLFSPGRGMFVYSPILIVPFCWFLRRFRSIQPFEWLAIGSIILHLIMMSLWPMWWAGHCYGARITVDVIPWLVLLAAASWMRVSGCDSGKSMNRAVFLILLLLTGASLTMQAIGVFSYGPWIWNVKPHEIDQHPERLWDWQDPPFLRGLRKN